MPGVCASRNVIGLGYSRSAGHLRTFLDDPVRPFRAYDGSLLGGIIPILMLTHAEGPTPCGTGKTIVVYSETELSFGGAALRDPGNSEHYRVLEVAGASHAPKELFDLDLIPGIGSNRQNLARTSPVYRASFRHLVGWLHDGKPPSSSLFDLAAPRGAEGAMSGGVRLPHVLTEDDDRTLGAPLGCYGGWGTPAAGSILPLFVVIGGDYDPACMPDYRTHGAYVKAVTHAARYALMKGWIDETDREAYVNIAARCPVGEKSVLSSADLRACHGL